MNFQKELPKVCPECGLIFGKDAGYKVMGSYTVEDVVDPINLGKQTISANANLVKKGDTSVMIDLDAVRLKIRPNSVSCSICGHTFYARWRDEEED